jgi:uncharacterized OB-fold protein
VRPLPQLTPFNEWFWTSGADGHLRIQGCDECRALVHPPVPICPVCRSRSSSPVVVSGRATVVGFTLNSHPWLPAFDLEPPYSIAVVALDEDPSVRLTTNIVGCPPADVHVGQQVAVRFEQHEDVWVPLFAPVAGVEDRDVAAVVGAPQVPSVRAPSSDDRFEHRAVLSGIGRSAMGRRLMVNPLSLTVDACLAAVADAGLTLDDIDGLSTYPGAGAMGMSEGGVTAVEEALRLRPTWINGGGDLPGPGGSVIAAMLAVASGLCRHVLCFRTVWESTYATLRIGPGAAGGGGGGRVSGPMQEWRAPFGAMSAANWIAMNANHYMHRYGAERELLGWIALNGRANAALNPAAIYRDPMTMDDYMSARPITSPFGLYDCDVPCDALDRRGRLGASVAGDLPRPPSGSRRSAPRSPSASRGTRTRSPTSPRSSASRPTSGPHRPAARRRRPGARLRRVHVQRHLVARGARLLRHRRGADWLDGGKRIALDGDLPVNPHGGSCRRAARTGSGSSTRRSPSCGARRVSGRCVGPGPPW